MNKKDFTNFLKLEAEIRTGKKFIVEEVQKPYGNYMGLRLADERITPCFNLDEMYASGKDITTLAKVIEEQINNPYLVEEINNYDMIKDKLFVKLLPANKEYLKDVPHRMVGDVAMIASVKMEGGENLVSANVTNQLLQIYGVSEEQLFSDALKSSEKTMPVELTDMGPFTCVANKMKMYGASALFYEGVLDELCRTYGDELYIIPSSVHEMLVLPALGDPDYIRETIANVNLSLVSKEDFLSNSLFYYDGDRIKVEE